MASVSKPYSWSYSLMSSLFAASLTTDRPGRKPTVDDLPWQTSDGQRRPDPGLAASRADRSNQLLVGRRAAPVRAPLEVGERLLELVAAARIAEAHDLPLVEGQRVRLHRLAGPRAGFVDAVLEAE